MSSLTQIPFEDLEIANITVLKDFIQPLLFPYRGDWKEARFLYVGEENREYEALQEQFPESAVVRKVAGQILAPAEEHTADGYEYIHAAGIGKTGVDIPSILTTLVSLLKPGGAAACGVNGYAGYYGLSMLGTIIKHMAADMEDLENPKNFAKLKRLTQTVIQRLPSNHPAFHRRGFMERLQKGEQTAIRELTAFTPQNIFTVKQLMQRLQKMGGSFMGWVIPSLYNPTRYVEKENTKDQLNAFHEPESWEIAEMVNGTPPEHYFFMGKGDIQPFKMNWESHDIYLWRPRRFPLYIWDQLDGLTANGGELEPIKAIHSLGPFQLKSWQAGLCQEATGKESLNDLSAKIKKPAQEMISFLKEAVERRLLTMLPPG